MDNHNPLRDIVEKDSNCALCRARKVTEWMHEDGICWVGKCRSCDKWMIVYRYHGEPTMEELEHMKKLSRRLFPNKRWRGTRKTIKDHWHEHIID